MTYGLVLLIFLAPLTHPFIQSFFIEYYEANFAQLVKMLYDLSKSDVDKSVAFGKKFAWLLVGWFALLFSVELVLRVLLLIIGGLLRLVFGKKSNTATVEVDDNKKND